MPTRSTKADRPGSVREIRQRQAEKSPYAVIAPNSEPQNAFASTPADVALYGGSNGGGKTFALLMEPLRHIHNGGFGAVFLRRTIGEITQEEGAWDVSEKIYWGQGGFPNMSERKWTFNSGASVKFAGIQHEKDLQKWGSSQIALILIDQAETFTSKIFWGLVARNRTTCGMRPYIRMGCNPDPDSFLYELFAWWIDEEGYAIPERSGVIRWAIRYNDKIQWADSKDELRDRFGKFADDAISFTFIAAKLADNVDLERANPEYRRRLMMLPEQERLRTLGDEKRGGNWKIKVGSNMFPPGAWRMIDYIPSGMALVRYWDTAATDPGDVPEGKKGAATAGVLIGMDLEGPVVVDVQEGWVEGIQRDNLILNTAKIDAATFGEGYVDIWLEEEPGGSGKTDAKANLKLLEGFSAFSERATGSKVVRAKPWSSAVQAGRVRIVNISGNDWVAGFVNQHANFPLSKRKDKVDAASGAYSKVIDLQPASETGILSDPDYKNPADSLPADVFQ